MSEKIKLKDKLKARAKQLKVDVPAVFLALKDKRTPWFAKVLAAIVVIYALSPVDLIPDFIPILGYLDDLIILPALIVWTVKLVPEDVMSDCREQAAGMWSDGKPKKWYYAIPFVMVWLLIVWLIVKEIFG